ncbi:MAG: LD-carboxypeptidase [archaeon]|nr:LD-carboxypeptidase [archaeon]
MEFLKPNKLNKGDIIGIVSPSWGGPGKFPHIFDSGIEVLKEWGLKIKEFSNTRADAQFLYENPKLRAEDVNNAFADKEVKAIITSIGGDDSVRILPFLDKVIIRNNPKILMGFSDTTTLLTFCNQIGLVTFHGPSIMAGFSQMKNYPESIKLVKDFLFSTHTSYNYELFKFYSEGYPDWGEKDNTGKIKPKKENLTGWKWIQGNKKVQGQLFGGNIEVLEFLKETEYWPSPDFWNGKILFLETSEEKPTADQVKYMLRNYGMQGIFDKINGMIFGRNMYYSDEEKKNLDEFILNLLKIEFKHPDLPVVTNIDFGHTDPQFIMPLGVKAEIDCMKKTIKLCENALN